MASDAGELILMARCGACWADPGEKCLPTASPFGRVTVSEQWFHVMRLRRAHRKGLLRSAVVSEYAELLVPLPLGGDPGLPGVL